jgi:Rrf2 family protein
MPTANMQRYGTPFTPPEIDKINMKLYLIKILKYAIFKLHRQSIGNCFAKKGGNKLIITRETDYALRILRALATGGKSNATEICERETLPLHFVYRIMKKLEKGGFVEITRGSEGGARLCVDLKSVSMYDLLSIIEGKRVISACMQPGFKCAMRGNGGMSCAVHRQLTEIQETLDEELRGRTLHRMLFADKREAV